MSTSKPIPFTKITVDELKDALRKKGLPVSGVKQVLYDRLYGSGSKTTDKSTKLSKNKVMKRKVSGDPDENESEQDASDEDESDDEIPQQKTKGKRKGQGKKQRLSIGPKSFSKWPNVCKKLGIDTNWVVDEEQFPKQQRGEDDLQKCTENMKEAILRRQRHQAEQFGAGSERAREFYVMAMLDEVMDFFDLEDFIINIEHPLGSDDAWGPVEFVFTTRNPERTPIGFVLELKKDDFEQGRAQLYLQLEVAHEENADNGANFDVYGALTTANIWVFVVYDGKNFYETDPCSVGSSPKFVNLDKVVDWLVAILDYIDDNKPKQK